MQVFDYGTRNYNKRVLAQALSNVAFGVAVSDVCLSVRLSHASIVLNRLHTSPNFFTTS